MQVICQEGEGITLVIYLSPWYNASMNTMDIIIRLIEAAALGALIGLEREVVSNRIISDFKNPQVIF